MRKRWIESVHGGCDSRWMRGGRFHECRGRSDGVRGHGGGFRVLDGGDVGQWRKRR